MLSHNKDTTIVEAPEERLRLPNPNLGSCSTAI